MIRRLICRMDCNPSGAQEGTLKARYLLMYESKGDMANSTDSKQQLLFTMIKGCVRRHTRSSVRCLTLPGHCPHAWGSRRLALQKNSSSEYRSGPMPPKPMSNIDMNINAARSHSTRGIRNHSNQYISSLHEQLQKYMKQTSHTVLEATR